MNITATLFLVGSLTALPATNLPFSSLTEVLPGNPFDGVSVSAAGIGVELTEDGFQTHPATSTDFQIEIRMKSGSPIRVRL